MYVEITVAVNYILSHLYTKLPRRRVDSFGEELERYLLAKFQHHWYPSDPLRDSAYRCINSVGPQVDILLPEAAAVSGLEWSEIETCLPEGLIISVDPGHVVCQYNRSNCALHERLPSNHWTSSSVSLSSSGCSSASSISSSNLINSSQITHKVLYSSQDEWNINNSNMLDESKRNYFLTKLKRFENDHGDLLSTATALSVLVEPDEGIDTKFEPNTTVYEVSSLTMNHTNWDNENSVIGTSIINQDEPSRTELNETDLESINPLQTEMYHEKEMSTIVNTTSFPWGVSKHVKESFLSTVGNNDSIGGIPSTTQSIIFNATKMHNTFPTFHRSSSNPPQSDQLTTTHNSKELIAFTTNFVNSNILCSKFDQSFNPMLINSLPKSYPAYIQPPLNSSNPFVQKSTSTPSFTAATFAQTKFGSTKLKSHPKRTPTRILSPTTTTTVQQNIAVIGNFLPNDVGVPTNYLTNHQVHNGGHNVSSASYWQTSFEKHLQPTTTTTNNITMITTDDMDMMKSDCTVNNSSVLCTNWNNQYHHSSMVNGGNITFNNHESNNLLVNNNLTRLLSTAVSNPIDQYQIQQQQQQQQQVNMKTDGNLTGSIQMPTSNDITNNNNNIDNNSNNNNNDYLLDDVLLSTQMVNLLLEEDNFTDSMLHRDDNLVNYLHTDNDDDDNNNNELLDSSRFLNIENHLLTSADGDNDDQHHQNDKDILQLDNNNNHNNNNNYSVLKESPASSTNFVPVGTSSTIVVAACSIAENIMPSMVATEVV